MSKSSMRSKVDTLKEWLKTKKPVAVRKEPTREEVRISDMPRFIKGMNR